MPNDVQNAITLAFLPLIRVATLPIVLSPWVKDSWSTILPPSCWKRSVKAWQTFWKYTSSLSVTTSAVCQPCA